MCGDGFTLGKEPSNALVIQDRFISNRHLKVTRREGGFHMVDLNSTNGTFLGSTRIFEAEIALNTALRVGETELLSEAASQGRTPESFHGLIGQEPAMRQLVEMIQRVGPSTTPVTILGKGRACAGRALPAGLHAERTEGEVHCGGAGRAPTHRRRRP